MRWGEPRTEGKIATYHTQQPGSGVLDDKVLVFELRAVYAERARSVVIQEIASLDHELGDAGGSISGL